MFSLVLLCCWPLLSTSVAAEFSLPLQRVTFDYRFGSWSPPFDADVGSTTFKLPRSNSNRFHRRAPPPLQQQVFDQHRSKSQPPPLHATKPYEYVFLYYTTEISLGTPPQRFIVAVDLSWSDLFVPSSHCAENPGYYPCLPWNKYNATGSSTYVANGTAAHSLYFAISARGLLGQDVLRLGSLDVVNQTFLEATHWSGSDGCPVDAVLGLARHHYKAPWITTVEGRPPLLNIMHQHSLERNVFTLTLPRSDDERGELTFNGDDELMEKPLVTLPVTNIVGGDDGTFLFLGGSGWQVSVAALSLDATESNSSPLDIPLPGYTAVISTYLDLITLPWSLADRILEHMDIDVPDYLGIVDVPCSRRKYLPDLTVSFGSHGSLKLTPWQYLLEIDDEDNQSRCIVPFNGDFMDDEDKDSQDPRYIVLGSVFVSSFSSTFDLDQNTISFANRAR